MKTPSHAEEQLARLQQDSITESGTRARQLHGADKPEIPPTLEQMLNRALEHLEMASEALHDISPLATKSDPLAQGVKHQPNHAPSMGCMDTADYLERLSK